MSWYRKYKIKKAFNLKIRTGLYNSFGFRCQNNLPIKDSLETYKRLYQDNNLKAGYYLGDVYDQVANGSIVEDAFKEFLPDMELTVIGAGEANNNLADGFLNANILCVAQNRIQKPLKSLIWNIVIKILIIFAFVVYMSDFSKTVFDSLSLKDLPFFAEAFLSFTGNISHYWWVYLLMIFSLIIYILWRLPRGFGKIRSFLHKWIFPFTIYRKYLVSSFLITLASLIKGGKSIKDSIDKMRDNASPYLMHYLDIMYSTAEMGKDEEEIFDVDLFDPFLKVNIVDLAKLKVPSALHNLAESMIDETVKVFEDINVTTDILMKLLMGIFIVWSFLSFSIPVFEMASEMLTKR